MRQELLFCSTRLKPNQLYARVCNHGRRVPRLRQIEGLDAGAAQVDRLEIQCTLHGQRPQVLSARDIKEPESLHVGNVHACHLATTHDKRPQRREDVQVRHGIRVRHHQRCYLVSLALRQSAVMIHVGTLKNLVSEPLVRNLVY